MFSRFSGCCRHQFCLILDGIAETDNSTSHVAEDREIVVSSEINYGRLEVYYVQRSIEM